jgi:3-oxoacyl-[acyl-carrier protein] reductase
MLLGLNDKTAIITGGARGLGAATARILAQEGVKVALFDINGAELERTAGALRDSGHVVTGQVCDITDASAVERNVAETIERFGAVHILVNNAGFPRDGYIVKQTEQDWDSVVDVILKGSFLMCRAVMPHLIKQGWGRIVNISSRAHLGNPGQANYSAAKAGILGLTRALSLESGRYGITVNAVAPGFIETEMVQALPNYDQIKERAIEQNPIKRVGLPDDIANAVAFLASEQASFISGETLHVTGGRYSS